MICRIITIVNPHPAATLGATPDSHLHSKFLKRGQYVEQVLLPQMRRLLPETAIFDAVTPDHFTVLNAGVSYGGFQLKVGYGVLGNFLSHLLLWEQCVALGSAMLILEDDAGLPAANELRVMEALTQYEAMSDCNDILYLQSQTPYLEYQLKGYHASIRLGNGLLRLTACNDLAGTAAYCVRPAAAGHLIRRAMCSGTLPTDCFVHTAFNNREIGIVVPEAFQQCFMLHEHWARWNSVHVPPGS